MDLYHLQQLRQATKFTESLKQQKVKEFGDGLRQSHFCFESFTYPLNHGSYGAIPKIIRDRRNELLQHFEEWPDFVMNVDLEVLLNESRSKVAQLLSVRTDEVVFVANATTGIDTILGNLTYEEGDAIIDFDNMSGPVHKSVLRTCARTSLKSVSAIPEYLMHSSNVYETFVKIVENARAEGHKIKAALFPTVTTFPGARFPWEVVTRACRDNDILSIVDGAHGLGLIDFDNVGTTNPDFFVSDCHNPSPAKGAFVDLFQKVGAIDPTPYILVADAIKVREVVFDGEQAIRTYCDDLARKGETRMAHILGTECMTFGKGSLATAFANVRLPLHLEPHTWNDKEGSDQQRESAHTAQDEVTRIQQCIAEQMAKVGTLMYIVNYNGVLWVRISAQIYLSLGDFEWAAERLKEVCQRVENGEYW